MRNPGRQSLRAWTLAREGTLFIPAIALMIFWCSAAFADDATDNGYGGPWKLAMSRAEVTAFADYGPYTDSSDGDTVYLGACDCKHGKGVFLLAFSADDHLELVHAAKFAGANYADARNAELGAFDYMSSHYGKVEIFGVKAFHLGSSERIRFLDKDAFLAVLDGLWGRAPRVFGKVIVGRGQDALSSVPEQEPDTHGIKSDSKLTYSNNVVSGHAANIEFTLDLVPETQPRDERVVAQLSYSTEIKKFLVAFYRDPPTAPDRTQLANVKFIDAGPVAHSSKAPSL